jgi:hypothetical protein
LERAAESGLLWGALFLVAVFGPMLFGPKLFAPFGLTGGSAQFLPAVLGVYALIGIVAAAAFAVMPTRDELVFRDGVLIETGCKRLQRFERRWPQESFTLEFSPLERTGRLSHRLRIRHRAGAGLLDIPLNNPSRRSDLLRFAPAQMQLYDESLAGSGKAGRLKP